MSNEGKSLNQSDKLTKNQACKVSHLFELFFTTKQEIKGSGLGLAVAKNVIQDHDGEISIESKEGKGTAVNIKIPIFILEAGHLSH